MSSLNDLNALQAANSGSGASNLMAHQAYGAVTNMNKNPSDGLMNPESGLQNQLNNLSNKGMHQQQ